MFDTVVLILSLLFQIATVGMAVSLIRLTGKSTAWLCISSAFGLMAIRRVLPFWQPDVFISTNFYRSAFETVGLAVSVLMFVGVLSIDSMFKGLYANEKKLIESEQRFRSYFELPIIGVAIVDNEHRFLTINSKFCEILSAAQDCIVGSSRFDWIRPEDLPDELEALNSMKEGKTEGYSLEKRLTKKTGADIWVGQALRCVRNADSSINYYIVVSEDISNRKKAENALTSTLAEKETLLRELYHRTKNNMQIICSLLAMECNRTSNMDIVERFHILESRIQSMALVHDKLYNTGNLSHLDLADYIRELAEMIQDNHRAEADHIEIRTSLESAAISFDIGIPCGIILNEIIANAYAHAFPLNRKGIIDIALRTLADGKIELRIADNGIGVPEKFDLRKSAKMGLDAVFGLCDQIRAQVGINTVGGLAYTLVFVSDCSLPRL